MSYFPTLLRNRDLTKHDGRNFWKYSLSENEYNDLVKTLQFSNSWDLDPRDATLYFAEWWKRNYNGGKPSKEEVFKSIGGNILYNLSVKDFYKSAKKGAAILGINWIKRQNVLYFRTLLLQGGLPINHIVENAGHYKNFLFAVLDEQPETIEDFSFQTEITNLLPVSSRNDPIYESCFEIVKSILNDEKTYEDLFNYNEVIRTIGNDLKIKKRTLQKRERITKPQNYWILNFKKEKPIITLRLGLASILEANALQNILGINETPTEKSYQFYLNDELVCTFRRMLSGKYKTDWSSHKNFDWTNNNQLPVCYGIVNNKRFEINDFIQIIPNLNEPSLWTRFSDNEWRLIKGNNINSDDAALLFPKKWQSNLKTDELSIYENTYNWAVFEGETELFKNDEKRKYLTKVNSFDWTIISQKPNWMNSSNMPVIQTKPRVIVYNEKNETVIPNKYKVYIKKQEGLFQQWDELSKTNKLSPGYYELKINKDEIIAYDSFYVIGDLQIKYTNQKTDSAKVIINNNAFQFKIDESPILNIELHNKEYQLQVDLSKNKIPKNIKASIKWKTSKSLFFELNSPFIGMELVNNDGNIIPEDETITFNHLFGIRIISPYKNNTIISMKNKLRSGVIISKEIDSASHPLINFKDELLRLFYLADAMNHENNVIIELQNGRNKKIYHLKGFTHSLCVNNQFEGKLKLHNSKDELELYAIPLNCNVNDINLIPLLKEDNIYKIPKVDFTKQFIIISSYESSQQLLPRFVNTDEEFIGVDKNERIENYHDSLINKDFKSEEWKELIIYFNICIDQKIPFSTFDQLRAISRSSQLASKAFFFLGINQYDINDFIEIVIPDLEKDLGFCFHWANKDDWEKSIEESINYIGSGYFQNILDLFSKYLEHNNLTELLKYINNHEVKCDTLTNAEINNLRSNLGERVLEALPNFKPNVVEKYNIPTTNPVEVLIRSAIAAAESISGQQKEFPIWGGNDFREKIRRNIQYTQYLTPNFYNKIILNVLSKS